MKKFVILLLLLFVSMPAFSAPGYNPDYKPNYYDVSEFENYVKSLKDNYWRMVDEGECSCSHANYTKYVIGPTYKYIESHPTEYRKNPN